MNNGEEVILFNNSLSSQLQPLMEATPTPFQKGDHIIDQNGKGETGYREKRTSI